MILSDVHNRVARHGDSFILANYNVFVNFTFGASKLKKAEAYGTKILNEPAFLKLL